MTKHKMDELLERLKTTLQSGGFGDAFKSVAKFLKVLAPETDRGLVLAGAAFLDNALGGLLRAYLVDSADSDKIFSHSGPLGTFSSRNDMAHALGLTDSDSKRDIDLIRKIRNECAHSEDLISFADQATANRIRELVCLRHFVKKLQQSQTGNDFDSLDEMFDDGKTHLILSIGILLFYISDTKQKSTRLTARESHVDEWNRIEL